MAPVAPRNTRIKLLDTALELFWHSSYGSVSVDDICKAAGVHKGSFYHFFDSKLALTVAAFEHFWEGKRPVMEEAFAPSLKPAERIKRYSSLIYRWQKEQADKTGKVPGCPFAGCGSELATQEEGFRIAIEKIFSSYSGYFQLLLEDAGTPRQIVNPIAEEMMAYVEGVIQQAAFSNDVELIQRLLLPGLLQYIDTDAAHKARLHLYTKQQEITPA
ncbi:MAG: TetR/AcrR family transcriptional regulator [Alphaproteobacteria bacterium]